MRRPYNFFLNLIHTFFDSPEKKNISGDAKSALNVNGSTNNSISWTDSERPLEPSGEKEMTFDELINNPPPSNLENVPLGKENRKSSNLPKKSGLKK